MRAFLSILALVAAVVIAVTQVWGELRIDPDAISRQAIRGADIYVACTRATQTLHLVTLVG